MKPSKFNPNTQGPGDERFTGGIQDASLNNAPSTTFRSLAAILVPPMGPPIYDVTSMVASLGEIEGWQQTKGIRRVKTLKGSRAGKSPVWVMRMQIWAGLLAAEFDRNKVDRQPIALLLELWRQLRSEQRFTKLGKHPEQEMWAVQLEDCVVPKDVPLDDALFQGGTGSSK